MSLTRPDNRSRTTVGQGVVVCTKSDTVVLDPVLRELVFQDTGTVKLEFDDLSTASYVIPSIGYSLRGAFRRMMATGTSFDSASGSINGTANGHI